MYDYVKQKETNTPTAKSQMVLLLKPLLKTTKTLLDINIFSCTMNDLDGGVFLSRLWMPIYVF